MKRVILSLLLLGAVFLMAGPVYAGDGSVSLRIVISPVVGQAGTEISVSGTGAESSQPVHLSLTERNAAAGSAIVETKVTPNPDGTFNATLSVPASTADGRYVVNVEQFNAAGNLQQFYWNAFTVGSCCSDALLPETGSVPGTPFTVTAVLAMLLIVGMSIRGVYAVAVKQ
ncbi:MAG TPA: hypothetical protein G4N96_05790 [Chloroflexi bacterium]|nr:MAG: hypothetical protein B6243_04805 [Anaerolineaceae bacterium 4572_5.2]HEY84604.1 hypothetical protein [Chloroflexota bacterium]